MDLRLLLASADDAAGYLKDGMSLDQAQKGGKPDSTAPMPKNLFSDTGKPNDLPAQRWGVIVPQEGGDELFARIKDLVDVRRHEQNGDILGDAPGQPFKVPANMGYEEAAAFLQKINDRADGDRPRYLLVLGSPQQVSMELQQVLSSTYFVGRLAFDQLDGYSSYAAKAAAWSRPETWRKDPRAVSYTVRTALGNDAPDDGYIKLMAPTVRLSTDALQGYALQIADLSAEPGPSTAQNFVQVAADARPTILMSMSHGLGRGKRRPWSDEELRRFQGQMSFGYGKDPLSASAISQGDFLPGGLWFYFACFGAGTPGISAYAHWLAQVAPGQDVLTALPQNGQPFIASLPQAALANPRGPLAVVGHMDLAWSYSYDAELTNHRGQARRLAKLTDLAKRDEDHPSRFGPAFMAFLSDLPAVHQDLTSLYDDEARTQRAVDLKKRANMWMLRQDLRAYVLLGDPAAYLPLAAPPPPPKVDPLLAAGLSFAQPAPRVDVNADKLLDDVFQILCGLKTAKGVAREHNVEASQITQWVDSCQQASRAELLRKLGQG
jgi:hypothetical protein